MIALFRITNDSEFSGAIVYLGGEPITVASTNPNYDKIVKHLRDEIDDDDTLLALIAPAIAVTNVLTPLTDRISYTAGRIYFDGDVLNSALADHIVRILDNGGKEEDYKPFANFLEKLSTNPSSKSKKHLYAYIEHHKVTILPDGDMLLYKGVQLDGTSSRAGYGIVNGEIFENAHLPNPEGAVVSIPRSMVDDDRGTSCSVGLHVGTYRYARSFAAKLLTVKVNPRDVVSVPSDSSSAKIRVARYVVLEAAEGEITTPSYYAPRHAAEPEPEEDWSERLDDDDEDVDEFPEGDWDEDEIIPADEDEIELSDAEVKANNKVEGFKKLIPTLDQTKLRRHRNKNVTAANRYLFDRALHELGLDG